MNQGPQSQDDLLLRLLCSATGYPEYRENGRSIRGGVPIRITPRKQVLDPQRSH